MSRKELLITNIAHLWQVDPTGTRGWQAGPDMANVPSLANAWLLCRNGRIAAMGPMADCPTDNVPTLDAAGGDVLPGWVDSHTHLVFSHTREGEFRDRLQGLSYQEIAAKGGGILNSARRLRETSEEDLLEGARERLHEVIRLGTVGLEIKSGYGLSVDSELKMLRVIRRLREESPIPIKASLLAAHALPPEYREDRAGYLRLIIEEILPQAVDEGLIDYIDCFCEKAFFQPAEMDQLLTAAARYDIPGKIHTNQFYSLGGIETAIRHQARSVDHLEVVTETEMDALLQSRTVPVLLPSAPFFLDDHYPPARTMIDRGLGVALASDYNPGTSPSGRMPFVIALACTQMKMLPEEAINAATINGAVALDLDHELGSIAPGKRANLILTPPIPALASIPYSFGSDLTKKVVLDGQLYT